MGLQYVPDNILQSCDVCAYVCMYICAIIMYNIIGMYKWYMVCLLTRVYLTLFPRKMTVNPLSVSETKAPYACMIYIIKVVHMYCDCVFPTIHHYH